MDLKQLLLSTLAWIVMFPLVKGKLQCDCTTLDCQAERRLKCEADYFCYVENMSDEVTRGCINEKSPLLCENRRPSKLAARGHKRWPRLHCCKDQDFCNRDIVPVLPTEKVPEPVEYDIDDENNPYVRNADDGVDARTPCPNSNSSALNPIYIAVPVAGVCVLLALIIFAMYLLRRRNDFYSSYEAYQYHEQLARLANKQNETKAQSCDTNNVNRCTDSERSSQGSETKLFINA